jgi:hypothetical protein
LIVLLYNKPSFMTIYEIQVALCNKQLLIFWVKLTRK